MTRIGQSSNRGLLDSRYVNVTGDTMTGKLRLPGIIFDDYGSLPPASSAYRGYLVLLNGTDTSWNSAEKNWDDTTINWDDTTVLADALYLCRKNESSVYEWFEVGKEWGLWDQT